MTMTPILTRSKLRHLHKILLFALILGLAHCERHKSDREVPKSEEMEKVSVVQSKLGRKIWRLQADRLEFRGDTTWAIDIILTFFDKGGHVASTLFADSGFVIQPQGDMVAYGHVYVISSDSSKLWTDSLAWNSDDEMIRTDAHVRIEDNGRILEGEGLESDAALKRIKIKGEVIGHGEVGERSSTTGR